MPDKTLAEEYKLEEMKLLRGEVELRGQERRSMERNVLLADAAIYSFVLAPEKIDFQTMHRLGWLVWYLPPMLAFLALIRWRESLKMIGHLAEHIRATEISILGEKGGWEQSLLIERKHRKVAMVSPWYMVFWGILIGGTLALAWYADPPYPAHRTNRSLWLGLIASALSILMISWPWLESLYGKRRLTSGTLVFGEERQRVLSDGTPDMNQPPSRPEPIHTNGVNRSGRAGSRRRK